MLGMLAIYPLMFKMYFAYWRGRWAEQEEANKAISALFKPITPASAMSINVLTYNAFSMLLFYSAGFSRDFLDFATLYIVGPSVCCSMLYYYHLFGTACFTSVNRRSVLAWLHNFACMCIFAAANATLVALFFFGGYLVEALLLPRSWQCEISFPMEVTELHLKRVVMTFWAIGLFCFVTLPLWRIGHANSMKLLRRTDLQVSLYETALELMYVTCQSTCIYQLNVPLAVLMSLWGLPFHAIHIALGLLEFIFINYSVKFKFCALHQAAHDIKPLYNMTHLEHHICKGIFPTTSTVGLWEFFAFCGGDFFTAALGSIPYLLLQTQYLGANILVHTMWPTDNMAQWHTLHHTIVADIYNVNVPSERDLALSRDYKKYHELLEKSSSFIRLGWLSDLVGLAMMLAAGLVLHYGLGWGVFQVWNDMILTCRS